MVISTDKPDSINYHIIDSQHPLWFGHCCLHVRSLIHSLSAACAAEEKAVCIAEQAVFWRGKITHRHHSPKMDNRKGRPSDRPLESTYFTNNTQ